MSTYGDGELRLPFFTVSILDGYSDDMGYSRVRAVQVETLAGTFRVDVRVPSGISSETRVANSRHCPCIQPRTDNFGTRG